MSPRIFAGTALALTLGACATSPLAPAGPSAPPLPGPAAPPSPAAIYGHGAYRTRDGGRGSCAGQSVALMRDTPAFRDRIQALYESVEHALKPVHVIQARSARLGETAPTPLVASTQCDASGGFAFYGLPGGSYFIIARVRQQSPSHPSADYVDMQHVTVDAGQAVDVRLAP